MGTDACGKGSRIAPRPCGAHGLQCGPMDLAVDEPPPAPLSWAAAAVRPAAARPRGRRSPAAPGSAPPTWSWSCGVSGPRIRHAGPRFPSPYTAGTCEGLRRRSTRRLTGRATGSLLGDDGGWLRRVLRRVRPACYAGLTRPGRHRLQLRAVGAGPGLTTAGGCGWPAGGASRRSVSLGSSGRPTSATTPRVGSPRKWASGSRAPSGQAMCTAASGWTPGWPAWSCGPVTLRP